MKIKDSGERRVFDTGAVRDIQEGKGRCDLMPLDVVGALINDDINCNIASFQQTAEVVYLYNTLRRFCSQYKDGMADMLLEVSKHYEEGCKKYGENNWQRGIPVHCYIDSMIRHYLKFLRGDTDEPHDRAFVWNVMCCAWTVIHKPEMNDLPVDSISTKELVQDKWQEQ